MTDMVKTEVTEIDGITLKEETVNSVPCMWHIPANAPDDRVILYLHGGGFSKIPFMTNTMVSPFAGSLAKSVGVSCLYVDYRLIPNHFFPCQLEDCAGAFRGLLDKGMKIAVFGESAGGNLALSLCHWLYCYGYPKPDAVAAVSPALMLSRSVVGRHYANGRNVDAPFVSPLWGDLSCLPPTYIQTGGQGGIEQLVYEDSLILAQRAEKYGVELTLDRQHELEHVYITHNNRTPPEQEGYDRIVKFLKSQLFPLEQEDGNGNDK